jgi:hypothetical protein
LEISQKQLKLGKSSESTLTGWILDLDQRGHPVSKADIQWMANKLLSELKGAPTEVGKCWTTRFITRHPEIKVDRYKKYDYKRALCEDPVLISDWFRLVNNTIKKYGILPEDTYNFDETGFQMGVMGSGSIVTSSTRVRKARSVQSGAREWVTAVETPTRSLATQVANACKIAMDGVTILQLENNALRGALTKYEARDRRIRKSVATAGVYNAQEVQDRPRGGI